MIAHLLGVAADAGPIEVEVAEALDAGDGEVLLRVRTRLDPGAGEEPVDGESGHLLSVRDGEIARTRVFLDWDEARGAAGLA